jgi:hypothetical protein
MEICMEVHKNLKVDLPYDPAIPLVGIYPRACNSACGRDTCTPLLIAALFTIVNM